MGGKCECYPKKVDLFVCICLEDKHTQETNWSRLRNRETVSWNTGDVAQLQPLTHCHLPHMGCCCLAEQRAGSKLASAGFCHPSRVQKSTRVGMNAYPCPVQHTSFMDISELLQIKSVGRMTAIKLPLNQHSDYFNKLSTFSSHQVLLTTCDLEIRYLEFSSWGLCYH